MTAEIPTGRGTDDRVEAAVERELRRRRIVLWTYVVLLAVPLIATAVAVERAQSSREAVTRDVTQAVTSRVAESVRPQVQSIVREEAKPAIQAQLAPALGTINARSAQIETSQRELRSQVTSLSEGVQSVRFQARVMAAPEFQRLPSTVQRVDSLADQATKNTEQIDMLLKRIAALENQLQSMQREVATMRKQP